MITRSVLLVDDEPDEGDILAWYLDGDGTGGFHLDQVRDLAGALEYLRAHRPDVVFLDCLLPPYANPAQPITELRTAGYAGPVVVSSMLSPREIPGVADLPGVSCVCKLELSPATAKDLVLRLCQ